MGMKLAVERLTEEPTQQRFEASPGWWAERVSNGRVARADEVKVGPLTFEVTARVLGSDLFLEGSMQGSADVQCSRCLARYGHSLRDKFRLVLEPLGDRVPADPESAAALARDGLALGDDLGTGWYRGPEIRLEAFLAEVVSLAIPIQPLCREDCAGLCPHCGADLGRTSCDCEQSKPSSPFAALAALRTGRGDGEGRA